VIVGPATTHLSSVATATQRTMRYSLLSAALPFFLSLIHLATADDTTRVKFAKLAQANNGVVKLDSKLHEEIIVTGRDWSVVVEYTALGKEYGCAPCGYVLCMLIEAGLQTHLPPAFSIPTSRL
jgi:hypothetical protein